MLFILSTECLNTRSDIMEQTEIYGKRACQLVKELASSEPEQLTRFNVNVSFRALYVLSMFKKKLCCLLGGKMQAEGLDVQSERNADHFGMLIHHLSLLRNKRCLMAYVHKRAEILQSLSWKVGRVLPPEIEEKLILIWTVDMVPPKDPYIKVRVLEDIGVTVLGDRDTNLACHSIHFLKRTDAEHYILQSVQEVTTQLGKSPTERFAPLASTFQRRLLLGIGSASLVAVGANFAGITSFLLGFSPETGRGLKLDVLYPIGGYSRCIEPNEGFEFIYPATWVGDQTLLYRAAGKAEQQRSLDPPPLNDSKSSSRLKRNFSEPVVAFGPPGSTGELNVSVIVSPVAPDFRIEAFGAPKEVGEAVVRNIVGSSRHPDLHATLIKANLRQDQMRNVNYYELEFRVDSSSFQRHNMAVCCTRSGRLYTLNAQAPESVWTEVKQDLYKIAASFSLT
ncbi:hypothetical protein Ancab_000729 [Ancistrocladus abbreviatus]